MKLICHSLIKPHKDTRYTTLYLFLLLTSTPYQPPFNNITTAFLSNNRKAEDTLWIVFHEIPVTARHGQDPVSQHCFLVSVPPPGNQAHTGQHPTAAGVLTTTPLCTSCVHHIAHMQEHTMSP